MNEKADYQMYQPSEMAGFMNAMYVYNSQLKQQIISGESPVSMPLDLMQLHSAEMTKGKNKIEAWNSFVNFFIEALKAISKDPASNIYFIDSISPQPLPLMHLSDND